MKLKNILFGNDWISPFLKKIVQALFYLFS